MVRTPDRVLLSDGWVDPARRIVRRGETEALLTTKEAELLAYLASRPGEPISRHELLQEVWEYHPNAVTRAVDVTVRRLRSKIEVDARRPTLVVTAHGMGYTFQPVAPPEMDRFVGREHDLSALRDALDRGDRLVTLTGPGGVGKTRLAQRLAAGRGTRCDLAAAADAASVLAVFASALGVPVENAEQLGHVLRARRDALVVVDNAEHVVDALAPLLALWAERAPEVRWIVTSRAPLELAGERVLSLQPLPEDEARELFLDRARAVRAELSAADVPPELVHRLDRLPLAIEQAAVWVDLLSPSEIAERLGAPLELLRDGAAPGAARHRGMRATIAWSWALLAPREREALSACSVFRGGFDVLAAEAVIPAGDHPGGSLAVLAELRKRSLLHGAPAASGGQRFELLIAVREFAAEQLAAARQVDEVEQRHAYHYLRRAEEAGVPAATRMERARTELDNLLAVHVRYASRDPDIAARAALALERALQRRGPAELYARVLGVGPSVRDPDLRARTLLHRALARGRLGHLEEAEADLRSVGDVLREASGASEGTRVFALRVQASVLRRRGRLDEARPLLLDAVDAARAARERVAEACALADLAAVHADASEHARAEGRYAEALALYRDLGDVASEADVLGNLGNVQLEAGRLADAERSYERALVVHRELGDLRHEGMVRSNLAVLQHERGNLEAAGALWATALSRHRRVGNRRFEGFALGGLGLLALERGELEEAHARTLDALLVFREVGDRRFHAIALARLAAVEARRGRVEAASAALEEARRLRAGEAGVEVLAGFLDLARGDLDAARCRLEGAGAKDSFERLSRRLLSIACDGPARG